MKTVIPHIILATFLALLVPASVYAQGFRANKVAALDAYPGRIKQAIFSENGQYLAVSTNNQHNTLELYDVNLNKIWWNRGGKNFWAGAVAFTTDNNYLIFSNYNVANDIALLDLNSKQIVHSEALHAKKITHLVVSGDGRYLASTGFDNQIIIWEIRGGKLFRIQSFRSHSGLVNDMAFNKRGTTLVASNTNQTVTVWNRTGRTFSAHQTIRFEGNIIKTLAFSPEGEYLLLGGTNKNIYVYQQSHAGKFAEHFRFKAHNHAIYDLDFSPDGNYLATASADYSVKIFRNRNGEFNFVESFSEHKSFVRTVAFSPTGNYLISAADDRSAILWKIQGVAAATNRYTATDTNHQSTGGIRNTALGLPPILSIESISFSERQLDAGEIAELRVKVKNTGPGDAQQLKVRLSSNNRFLNFPAESVFPTLASNGGEETFVIDVRANQDLNTSYSWLDVAVVEENFGIVLQGNRIEFKTAESPKPSVKLAEFAVLESASANPNHHIDLNEMIDVVFILQNTGQGQAENLLIEVGNNQNGVLLLGHVENGQIIRESPKITKLLPGKYRKVTYRYFVNSEFKSQKLIFEVAAQDDRGDVKLQSFHEVDINKDLKPLGEIWVMDGNDPHHGEVDLETLPELNIDIRQNIPKGKQVNEDAIAVIIGNRDYRKADVPSVDYALNDALLMKQYLMKTFGYREGNILFYPNATQADFNAVFGSTTEHRGKLFNYVKPNQSDVFIYYSGHGAPDLSSGEGYFVPVDCDPSVVSLNGYGLNTFYENVSKIPFKSLNIVIDACFSGNSDNGMLIKNASPVVVKPRNKVLQHEKAIVFTSASNEQISSWYPQKKHSLFTYFFLKGIQGAANSNKNSYLSVGELQEYINENIPYMARRLHHREQSPETYGDTHKVFVSY